jgi:glycosyltransferase involved in cell wall biosynthesis
MRREATFAMKSRPRILYVWQAGFPWDVRVEKVCLGLRDQGFEVEILARCRRGEELKAAHRGLAIHRVGAKLPSFLSLPVPGNLLWHRALRSRISELKVDLVIARDLPLALTVAHEARRAGIPWIMDMAEHYPEAMRTWKKYQANPFLKFLVNDLKIPDRAEGRAVRQADGVITVCDEQKDRLARDYAYPHEKMVSVLNTSEKSKFASVLIPAKRRGKCFGYHGNLIQDRDLGTVIRGFDLAAARDPEVTLVIAGSGESLAEIQTEIARTKNHERITLLGAFKPEQLLELYGKVDFGIVSLQVNEFTHNTLANKFFDYAACGKPILFAATRPMLKLMKRMKCGRPYHGGDPESVAEAMMELMASDYVELSGNGKRAVETEFHWEADVTRMNTFVRGVLRQSHRAVLVN